MKEKLGIKIFRIVGISFFSMFAALLITVNFVLKFQFDSLIKNSLKKEKETFEHQLYRMIDSELQRISLISRTPELNYLLKFNVKKNVRGYDLKKINKYFYEEYKEIDKKIDYLIIANYWKKLLYSDYGMRDKTFEIFNKEGKKLAFSKRKEKIKETVENDYRILEIIKNASTFPQKNRIIDFEENEGFLYFKMFIPIPEDFTEVNGVLVVSYPLKGFYKEDFFKELNSKIIFVDKNFFYYENQPEKYSFYNEKDKILSEKVFTLNFKNQKNVSIFNEIKSYNGESIGYMGFLYEKSKHEKIVSHILVIIGFFSLCSIIIFQVFFMRNLKNILKPIEIFIKSIRKMKIDTYEIIEEESEIEEMEYLRKEYNSMISSLKNKVEAIKLRDNQLEKVNKKLLKIIEEKEAVYKESITDGMTGTYNYRYFKEKLENELNRAMRYEYNLSLILLDIDFFKKINDTYGHQKGDEILREVSKIIKKELREEDVLSRYGGEEFVAILPHTDSNGAFITAERIRKKVEEKYMNTEMKITISIGISSYPEYFRVDFKNYQKEQLKISLIKKADVALYFSKENGRNKTTKALEDTTID